MSEQSKTTYTKPICRGCWGLGNNCRVCERCIETKPSVGGLGYVEQPPARYAGTVNELKQPVIVECVSGAFVHFSDYDKLRTITGLMANRLDECVPEMNRLQAALHEGMNESIKQNEKFRELKVKIEKYEKIHANLTTKWRAENGDYPESKRDCADELQDALGQI